MSASFAISREGVPSRKLDDHSTQAMRSDAMAKRQSVNFPGFAHQNPIPNASRIGNVMMTSVISGVDPGTRTLPPELAKQVTNLFTHVRTAIETAGGTPDDIIKMTFWMRSRETGPAASNANWA